MIIRSAEFVTSSSRVDQCPEPKIPEYAFIGRSNVGKSSLINMLTGFSKLAKISGTPGKTQTINHFIINGEWYLADLPGYGYARVSKKMRENWHKTIERYILTRENMVCLFALIDCRHNPIMADLEFMEFLGINQVPFARVFTKIDKQTPAATNKVISAHNMIMLEKWESLPETFMSSANNKTGRDDLLDYIEKTMTNYNLP